LKSYFSLLEITVMELFDEQCGEQKGTARFPCQANPERLFSSGYA
jgi:hypothetical protein